MLVQDARRIAGIYLLPHFMQFEVDGRTSPFMRYRDLPDLRLAFGEFLLELLAERQNGWFPTVCGRCGNSCRRPQILVREQEIFDIQMQLGVTQEQFRQTYLEPAATWNDRDGYMRHTAQGACPFLVGEGPGEASCSIHSVRPRSCREFLSNQAFCRKDPGNLLQSLTACWIRPEQIVVQLEGGQRRECPGSASIWEKLTRAIMDSPDLEDRRLPELVDSVEDVLREEIRTFHPSKVNPEYYGLMARLRKILDEAVGLIHMGEREESLLDEAWRRFHHLERLLSRPVSTAPAPAASPASKRPWDSLWLSEGQLVARLPFGIEHPLSLETLQSHSRELVLAVLSTPDEILQEALARPEPQCTLCGECCRRYLVEIHPSDIARLSGHLGIATPEFVEEYTDPSIFSWNLKDRILKKQACDTYSRNLLELKLQGQDEDEQCVFLERRADGLFYCRVHSHKPDVCRGYQADNKLCRKSNHYENPGRQAESLAWIEIGPHDLIVQTRARAAKSVGPLVLSRAEWDHLDSTSSQLEQACLKPLSATWTRT